MNNEFKKIKANSETRYVLETATAGATGTGSIATSVGSVGKVQKRNPDNILAQEADTIKVPVKQKPRQGPLRQQTGAGAHRDKKKEQKHGKEKHRKPFTEDHEIQMAGNELKSITADAMKLLMLIKRYSEMEGLEAWQQSKITKAADYLNSVLQSIGGEQDVAEGLRDPKDNPCWKGYKPVGTKKKGGRTVPNCVPKEGVEESRHGYDDAGFSLAPGHDEGEPVYNPRYDRTGQYDRKAKYSQDYNYRTGKPLGSEPKKKGYMFYNVSDEQTAQKLGLKQTKSGKWYLPADDKFRQQTADKVFGKGRLWEPKSEGTVESLDTDSRTRLDDLIDQYRTATDPSYDGYGVDDHYDPDEVIAQIRQEFGDRIADQVEAGADKMHFPRAGHQYGYDPLGWKKPIDRQTKAGKMYKQDSDYRKNTIKSRYRLGGKSATQEEVGYDEVSPKSASYILRKMEQGVPMSNILDDFPELSRMMELIAGEYSLHPDDDFEQIEDILMNNLEDIAAQEDDFGDYDQDEEPDEYMESLAQSLYSAINEKAVSKAQQRFMGMVHAAQKGEKPASKEVAKAAKGMGKKDAKDFAATKHKGLPDKKSKK